MRAPLLAIAAVLLPALLFVGCSEPDDLASKVSDLDRRLASVEAEQRRAHADDLRFDVAWASLPREARGGDEVVVESVRGTHDTFVVGGRYEVRGRYTLVSAERGSLILSVTETSRLDEGRVSRGATIRVLHGSGTFVLPLSMFSPGRPHVSLYDRATDAPVAGVYLTP